MPRKKDLDYLDIQLLNELLNDGSLNNNELARRIKLSSAPTLKRVQKLKEKGFIKKYTIELGFEKLGLFQELIQFVLLDEKKKDFVFQSLSELPYVLTVFGSSVDFYGSYNVYYLLCSSSLKVKENTVLDAVSRIEYLHVSAHKELVDLEVPLKPNLNPFINLNWELDA
ncbi:DNA-binding Lrp family transcriptional regulator [Roseivirga pacifica]|uniref:DNA-binding transcriptional regulator, Lrp family n=1 Tax=Roseivirga pacifica TaxID=1267423 RepID=A0A1I0QIN9_9BACT|nr:winged helix-turn-helix transcriptional regulator [Roseivirga pacifica]RKQ42911.1 DNA-binding Lrp family transcriptional regulator [Roseivirga pacifica]SEW26512.1 DNA-binding transcriptional regulator, Lrp family [Roseivirga pacifica]